MKRTVCIIIAVVLMLLCSFTAFAENKNQQLIIEYSDDKGPLTDVMFSVYRLGDVKGTHISPDSKFAPYSVSYDISDSEKLVSLALTLSAYAQRDDLEADFSDRTDEQGKADFDGVYFQPGAYLYIGEKHFQYGNIYFCDAAIIILPYGATDSVVTKPKFESVPEETTDISISYKVLKAWHEDDIHKRPTYIEAQLLRDGEIYDTVILNDENNWRYKWTGLSTRYQWLVTEKVVADGYAVSLSKNEKTYMLANSGAKEDDSAVVIESTTHDDSEITTLPDVSTTTNETTTSPNVGENLPQTGALKWPVPYLACIGMILLIAGYVTYRKSELNNEQQ